MVLENDRGPRFAEDADCASQDERFSAFDVDLQEIGWSAPQRLVEGRGHNPRLPIDWRGVVASTVVGLTANHHSRSGPVRAARYSASAPWTK